MCAIFGFVSRKDDLGPSLRTLQAIVRGNFPRGPHAFGFSWIDARGRLRMFKQTGRLVDDLGILAMARGCRMLIGHLRYATHGDASDNLNNHPHPVDGGWLVHNGVVTNYQRLMVRRELSPLSECDSELLGLLAEQSDAQTLSGRVADSIEQTDGRLAMLGLWNRPAALIAARRGNPLHVAYSGEGMYLATLAEGLPGRPTTIADNRLIRFSRQDGRIACTPLPIAEPAAPADSLWGGRSGVYCGG